MKKLKRYISFGLIFLLSHTCYQLGSAQSRFETYAQKFGSNIHLIYYAKDSFAAKIFQEKSLILIDSLNLVFSDYEPHSEVRRLSEKLLDQECISVSTPLMNLLRISKEALDVTAGNFDAGLGRLTKLWRQQRKENEWPKKKEIKNTLQKSGLHNLQLDEYNQKVCKNGPVIELDFGGNAKGYIADQILQLANEMSINSILIDLGGDILCGNAPPESMGWKIEIEGLDQQLLLSNEAITSSGSTYQYQYHEGVKYSHILDPQTGYPIKALRKATVIADSAVAADIWSSVFCILDYGESQDFADREKLKVLVKYPDKIFISEAIADYIR